MNKDRWQYLKSLKPKVVEVIAPVTDNKKALHGPKILDFLRHNTGKKTKSTGYTNHERVQILRAAKMGITPQEYKVRSAIFQVSGDNRAFTAKFSRKEKSGKQFPAGFEKPVILSEEERQAFENQAAAA